MSAWAPDDAAGRHAYVITTREWDGSRDRIEYADSLKDAKAKFGYTRMLHVSISVRRARPEDVA